MKTEYWKENTCSDCPACIYLPKEVKYKPGVGKPDQNTEKRNKKMRELSRLYKNATVKTRLKRFSLDWSFTVTLSSFEWVT